MNLLRTSAVSGLRGISQIFLAENALTGALILAGMAASGWKLALLAAVGCAVQSLLAAALHLDGVNHGLMGFNGALVGAAAAAAGAPLGTGLALTAAGAAAVIPVHLALARVPRIPVATAPFCLVAGLLFGPLGGQWETGSLTSAADTGKGLLYGFLNGFAEVVLADGPLPGLIILVALFLASWEVGALAALGSAAGLALSLTIHPDVEAVSTGLFNYSAVLIAIAVGTVLWPRAGWGIRVGGALAGVVLSVLIQWAMSGLPVPTYTWPFVISLWIMAACKAAIPAKAAGCGHHRHARHQPVDRGVVLPRLHRGGEQFVHADKDHHARDGGEAVPNRGGPQKGPQH